MTPTQLHTMVAGPDGIGSPFLRDPYCGYIQRPDGLFARDRQCEDWVKDITLAHRFTGAQLWTARGGYGVDSLNFIVIKDFV